MRWLVYGVGFGLLIRNADDPGFVVGFILAAGCVEAIWSLSARRPVEKTP